MAVYSTAVSPLYFTDEQTETIKPALTCRGSPYSTKISDLQTDPYKAGNGNSITDDEKAGKLSEAEWSGKGAERDWPHRKVIVYAGLVQGSFTASTRTGGAE